MGYGAVYDGVGPYRRGVGPVPASQQYQRMTRAPLRLISLTSALALVLSLLVVAPVAAETSIERAEKYAHSLLNCTRTGGWVKADGTCVGRGSGKYSAKRPALRMHKKIGTRVARPFAKKLAIADVCGHSVAGVPGLATRMRQNGFRHYTYGENVGCGWGNGDPKATVLMTHRMMQAEKSSKGGHWKNMKNTRFKSVGIGVAKKNGRIMVVYDFYGKKY